MSPHPGYIMRPKGSPSAYEVLKTSFHESTLTTDTDLDDDLTEVDVKSSTTTPASSVSDGISDWISNVLQHQALKDAAFAATLPQNFNNVFNPKRNVPMNPLPFTGDALTSVAMDCDPDGEEHEQSGQTPQPVEAEPPSPTHETTADVQLSTPPSTDQVGEPRIEPVRRMPAQVRERRKVDCVPAYMIVGLGSLPPTEFERYSNDEHVDSLPHWDFYDFEFHEEFIMANSGPQNSDYVRMSELTYYEKCLCPDDISVLIVSVGDAGNSKLRDYVAGPAGQCDSFYPVSQTLVDKLFPHCIPDWMHADPLAPSEVQKCVAATAALSDRGFELFNVFVKRGEYAEYVGLFWMLRTWDLDGLPRLVAQCNFTRAERAAYIERVCYPGTTAVPQVLTGFLGRHADMLEKLGVPLHRSVCRPSASPCIRASSFCM